MHSEPLESIDQGSSLSYGVRFMDETLEIPEVIDITGWDVYLTIKKDRSGLVLFQKKNIQTDHLDSETGLTIFTIPRDATLTWEPGEYYFDVRYRTPAGVVGTYYSGIFDVHSPITDNIY